MITLRRDTLTLTFPEIAQEVRSLIYRKIKQVAAELPPTWARTELISQIESDRDFPKLATERRECIRERLRVWTPADVESALEEIVINKGGLRTDSFTGLEIKFQRTMRIPADGKTYALPIALRQPPLHSVDDFPETAPSSWLENGGVVMPLARSEAIWIWFATRYPVAVKISTQEINLLSGTRSSPGLQREPQNYFVIPVWGESEVARRFIVLPFGDDHKAGQALPEPRGNAIQIQATPLQPKSFYKHEGSFHLHTIHEFFARMVLAAVPCPSLDRVVRYSEQKEEQQRLAAAERVTLDETLPQQIAADEYHFDAWDQHHSVGCVVHTCGPRSWQQITSTNPPYSPLTANEYRDAGIPWFDDYADDSKMLMDNLSENTEIMVQRRKTRRHSEIRGFKESPRKGDMRDSI